MQAPQYLNLPVPLLWTSNGVHSGTSQRYHTGEHVGTNSIKSVIRGKATWVTPEGRFEVDPLSFLVLNHGQSYSLEIDSREPTVTMAVFFKPKFLEEIVEAEISNRESLLDGREPRPFGFHEIIDVKDERTSHLLRRLHRLVTSHTADALEIDEVFVQLGSALVSGRTRPRSDLGIVRCSVRQEISRRLARARSFMLESRTGGTNLEAIAAEAWMSPCYFHRLFKAEYGETPHQFLTRVRLARAKAMLRDTDDPVWVVADRVGFESVSHFCRLFKKSTGHSPSEYRPKTQD